MELVFGDGAAASPSHVAPLAARARQPAARYAWIAALGRDGGGTQARQATTQLLQSDQAHASCPLVPSAPGDRRSPLLH